MEVLERLERRLKVHPRDGQRRAQQLGLGGDGGLARVTRGQGARAQQLVKRLPRRAVRSLARKDERRVEAEHAQQLVARRPAVQARHRRGVPRKRDYGVARRRDHASRSRELALSHE